MLKSMLLLALWLLMPLFSLFAGWRADDVEMVVIVCSYNNERYVKENLKSLFKQDYPKWEMIYINDCSSDRTGEIAEKMCIDYKLGNRASVIHNQQRAGGLANTYFAVHVISPNKVVVLYDGDDTFKDKKVLSRIAKIYRNKKVWLTYGNYETEPKEAAGWCKDPCYAFSQEVMKNNAFREHPWVAYPLRTFYAKLFQNIREEDLKYNGQFLPVAWDAGMMYPMLEMASKGHIYFEKKVLYVYRVNTGQNDFYLRKPMMEEIGAHLKRKKPYTPLKKLF